MIRTIEVTASDEDLRYVAQQLLTQSEFVGCRFDNIANMILEQVPQRDSERFFFEEISPSVIGRKLLRWKCGPWVVEPHKDLRPQEVLEIRCDGSYVKVYATNHHSPDLFIAKGGWIEVEL